MLRNSIRGTILGFIVGFSVSWGAFAPAVQELATEKMMPRYVVEELNIKPIKIIPAQGSIAIPEIPKMERYSKEERKCLAKNIFFEAGVESLAGKIAVAQVTLNRLKTKRWGTTICQVVYKKAQFSWTLSKKKRNEVPKGELWEQSKFAAALVLDNRVEHVEVANSLFYHTNYIREPAWASERYKLAQVGQHIFYEKDVKK